jgi:hypothetical protein
VIGLRVAVVCADDRVRMLIARAFDAAPLEWEITMCETPPPSADVVVTADEAIPGAVYFDPDHPERLLKDVEDNRRQSSMQVVSVFGATGGCGTSTIALHLAARAKASTCVLVADRVSAALRLGLEPNEIGREPVPVPGGFRIACCDDADLTTAVLEAQGRFEAILIDAGRAWSDSVVEQSARSVFVLPPSVPGGRSALRWVERFPHQPTAFVVNRLGPGGEVRRSDLERVIGRRVATELPCVRRLRDAEDDGRLLAGWSPWTLRVGALAGALDLA